MCKKKWIRLEHKPHCLVAQIVKNILSDKKSHLSLLGLYFWHFLVSFETYSIVINMACPWTAIITVILLSQDVNFLLSVIEKHTEC